MGDSYTDKELVQRVQQGDKQSFDLLVLKYQNRIIKLVSRYVREQSDAMDVAQETFIKAYRALPNFRGDSAFYTWLYRIAINTAKNYLVSLSRRPAEAHLENADGQPIDIEELQKDIENPENLLFADQVKQTAPEQQLNGTPEIATTAPAVTESVQLATARPDANA
ncbi:MAG TPA: sigma-70 family RNA polymerase sigma factor, partial [Gammaproteobacteria bacterium]|nr:sigma-70 family RNA polymerase sigma factor [Gammaproteobacteria bacterium]